jgi:hypothetical protein
MEQAPTPDRAIEVDGNFLSKVASIATVACFIAALVTLLNWLLYGRKNRRSGVMEEALQAGRPLLESREFF